MVSMQQGLQGRNVYDSGSYAPTRGAVSARGAQGYMQREVRKGNVGMFGGASRVGNDGQSDTRSGVADQAMKRRMQNGMNNYGGGMGGGRKQPFNNGGRQDLPNQQGQNGMNPYNPNPSTSNGTPVGQPPAVTVNNNGTIELPFNPAFSQGLYDLKADSDQQLLDLKFENDAFNAQNLADRSSVNASNVEAKRANLNGAAGGGLAFSSAYGTAVGKQQDAFTTAMSGLDTSLTQENSNYGIYQNAILDAFRDQVNLETKAYTESLAEEAGNLGYGTNKPKPGKGQNSSAYVNHGTNHAVDGRGKNKPRNQINAYQPGKGNGKGNTKDRRRRQASLWLGQANG